MQSNDWRQVLVFTRTKHGANRLAQQLTRGIEADAIHGNKAQNHRTRTLKRFKDNELRVLVATDIAARGLDIEACRTSSTSTCRTSPRTTCTASAAPAAPGARGWRS